MYFTTIPKKRHYIGGIFNIKNLPTCSLVCPGLPRILTLAIPYRIAYFASPKRIKLMYNHTGQECSKNALFEDTRQPHSAHDHTVTNRVWSRCVLRGFVLQSAGDEKMKLKITLHISVMVKLLLTYRTLKLHTTKNTQK